jgi:hypothetical protein
MLEEKLVNRIFRNFTVTASLSCAFLLTASTAGATVLGQLDIGVNTSTVSVGTSTIDWNGPFTVTNGTTLTYDTGTALPVGTTGDLTNLNAMTTVFPLDDFMTFNGIAGLAFNLSSIGPGSADTDCAAATAVGDSCSAFTGSPFVLTATSTGTEVGLSATGTAVDGSGKVSTWFGAFDETITALAGYSGVITPADIQSYFGANPTGAITSPYSGTFIVSFTSTPEPSTMVMMLLGGGLIALTARRNRRSN